MFHERRADPAMESTGQAPSWRPGVSTYRCFLPDLTGFAGSRRTRPNRPNPSQDPKEILPRPPAFGKRERPHFLPGNRIARGETGNHAYNMVLEGMASAGPAARANNHKSFRVAACMISTRFETPTPRSFRVLVLAFARHSAACRNNGGGAAHGTGIRKRADIR